MRLVTPGQAKVLRELLIRDGGQFLYPWELRSSEKDRLPTQSLQALERRGLVEARRPSFNEPAEWALWDKYRLTRAGREVAHRVVEEER